LNPYVPFETADFKSAAFTDFATQAAGGLSGPRKRKWEIRHHRISREFGAGNEARTRDLNLGKVALYQLSYTRAFRSACRGWTSVRPIFLERVTRLELVTSTLARLRSTN
jgi:hypothetical protein